MGDPSTAVADLVVKLHSNIDDIHACIQSLSDTASHDAELERLSTERETKIAELRQAHEDALKELQIQRENEARELQEQRRREEEELEAERKREYEELMARRRREDEERAARVKVQEEERARVKKEEDERREKERVDTERSLQEKVEKELERLEDEMERKVEEGKRALRELDEKRKVCREHLKIGDEANRNRRSMSRLIGRSIRRVLFLRLRLGVERRRCGANREIFLRRLLPFSRNKRTHLQNQRQRPLMHQKTLRHLLPRKQKICQSNQGRSMTIPQKSRKLLSLMPAQNRMPLSIRM